MTWRARLKVHPAAELFPLMSEDELSELAADVKKNGLREKVKLIQGDNGDYAVLDGRNPLDALELIGADLFDSEGGPDFGIFYCKDLGDPTAYVISRNIRRRHLTRKQKHELVANLIKLDPTKSDRQIAAMAHADRQKTVAPIRRELEDVDDSIHVETRTDSIGRQQPASKPPPPPSAPRRAEIPHVPPSARDYLAEAVVLKAQILDLMKMMRPIERTEFRVVLIEQVDEAVTAAPPEALGPEAGK
jgi:hypothetical protein